MNRVATPALVTRAAGPWALGAVAALVVSSSGGTIRSAPTASPPGATMTAHATGTFAPVGPPIEPTRVDAGGHCVVDLRQRYDVSGTLEGSFLIDYRILTYGPCPEGPPRPGTYEETWIAHGTFTGTFGEREIPADFTYTARVHRGGAVEGSIELGGGLKGDLAVTGVMAERVLSYDGQVEAS